MEIKKRDAGLVFNEIRAQEANDAMIIEGYFAVFNTPTMLWRGFYEKIASTAFDETLGNDIRALINHDTTMVLGRSTASTLKLTTDTRGLFGKIYINPKDHNAVSLYERVKRGDVNQCSFGFNIIEEEMSYMDDGSSVLSTLKKVDLHEVSVCTFPAYENTSVQARSSDFKNFKREQFEQLTPDQRFEIELRKEMLRDKLKAVQKQNRKHRA